MVSAMKAGKPVVAEVTVEHANGAKETTTEKVADYVKEDDDSPPVEVGFAMGVTMGTGVKFEFCRIDVSVKIPCDASEMDDVYKYAEGWVEERLGAKVEEIKETLAGNAPAQS